MSAGALESFSLVHRVRYDECGPGWSVRASTYLRLLQELAFAHSEALGFSPRWHESTRLFWLARRLHLEIRAPARHGERLVCTTHIVGARRVMVRRHSSVAREDDGARIAAAEVDWILTAEGTTPIRIPEQVASTFPGMERPVAPTPLAQRRPPTDAPHTSLWIRMSDTDAMGHANNPVYVDLLDDAVARAGGGDALAAYPRTYGLEFHAAAAAGAAVREAAWSEAGLWHYRLERQDGGLIAHAVLDASAGSKGAGPSG